MWVYVGDRKQIHQPIIKSVAMYCEACLASPGRHGGACRFRNSLSRLVKTRGPSSRNGLPPPQASGRLTGRIQGENGTVLHCKPYTLTRTAEASRFTTHFSVTSTLEDHFPLPGAGGASASAAFAPARQAVFQQTAQKYISRLEKYVCPLSNVPAIVQNPEMRKTPHKTREKTG